jgi:hypothetical protein
VCGASTGPVGVGATFGAGNKGETASAPLTAVAPCRGGVGGGTSGGRRAHVREPTELMGRSPARGLVAVDSPTSIGSAAGISWVGSEAGGTAVVEEPGLRASTSTSRRGGGGASGRSGAPRGDSSAAARDRPQRVVPRGEARDALGTAGGEDWRAGSGLAAGGKGTIGGASRRSVAKIDRGKRS